jgi:hypothetical protein
MDVENTKDNQAVHLEISPKATLQEARFEGLTVEEERVLEKKRECSVQLWPYLYDVEDTFC